MVLKAIRYASRRENSTDHRQVHYTYFESDIWASFQNFKDWTGIYVISFARYGSQFASEQLSTERLILHILFLAQTVTLRHIDHDYGPAGLLFTKDEFDGMVQ